MQAYAGAPLVRLKIHSSLMFLQEPIPKEGVCKTNQCMHSQWYSCFFNISITCCIRTLLYCIDAVTDDTAGDAAADKVDEVVSTLKVGSNHVGESAAQSQGHLIILPV